MNQFSRIFYLLSFDFTDLAWYIIFRTVPCDFGACPVSSNFLQCTPSSRACVEKKNVLKKKSGKNGQVKFFWPRVWFLHIHTCRRIRRLKRKWWPTQWKLWILTLQDRRLQMEWTKSLERVTTEIGPAVKNGALDASVAVRIAENGFNEVFLRFPLRKRLNVNVYEYVCCM